MGDKKTIIEQAGGMVALAKIANVPVKTARNWYRPKAQRGCGGVIPERYRGVIMVALPDVAYNDFALCQQSAASAARSKVPA